MPTQQQIADHLDLSQKAVSDLMEHLAIDWKRASLDSVRIAYIRNLRAKASGHQSEDGLDLVRERVLTERVDRELKELQVAEKKSVLINVAELEPQLMNMIGAFRSELLSRDDKLKAEIDALYGIDTDLTLLNEHTRAALSQLSRYDPSGAVADSPLGSGADAAGGFDHDGMGAALSGDEPEGIGAAGAI